MSDVLDDLRRAATEKVAMDPLLQRTLLSGGLGALAGAVPTAMIMKAHEDAAKRRASNVGFGAGVATGLAGPEVVRNLHLLLRGPQP